ncbi:Ionotropic receptor 110 [Hyalella azteca]|uniref:Ionotropic receptor 110 n=1 Tax=Hyalella azteca TaxID=294128 RepID=A0A6A0GTU2_HYAAZ|nr:Ionotropic receptor 110 [Hyalella azteca]
MRARQLKTAALLAILSVYSTEAKFEVNLMFNETSLTYTEILKNLITETLSGDAIMFLYDQEIDSYADLDEVSRWAADFLQSTIWISLDILRDSRVIIDKYYLRGETMIIFLLYHRDPTPFLDAEALSTVWNPDYLILLGVESEVSSKSIIANRLFQRSLYVVSIDRIDDERNRFAVHQMQHKIPGQKAEEIEKLLGIYQPDKIRNKAQLFGAVHFNMTGGVLDLASNCYDKPFVTYDEKIGCQGFSLNLLSIVANKYGFSYNTQLIAADNEWGTKANGTWNGLLVDLIINGKHLVINNFPVTEDVYTDFDITFPYFSEGQAFIIRNPAPLPEWLGLIYPFSKVVWILSIFTSAIAILFNTAIMLIAEGRGKSKPSLFLIMSSILEVDHTKKISQSWVMMWMSCWQLSSFVLLSAYTSNLVACLTVPRSLDKILTVEDLVASNLRILHVDYGDFLTNAMQTSEDPALRTLGERIDLVPNEYNYTFNTTFPGLYAGTHAVLDAYSYLFLERHEANLGESTYFMRETGSDVRVLLLAHLQGPFMMLGSGLLLALVVFTAELIYVRCTAKKNIEL